VEVNRSYKDSPEIERRRACKADFLLTSAASGRHGGRQQPDRLVTQRKGEVTARMNEHEHPHLVELAQRVAAYAASTSLAGYFAVLAIAAGDKSSPTLYR